MYSHISKIWYLKAESKFRLPNKEMVYTKLNRKAERRNATWYYWIKAGKEIIQMSGGRIVWTEIENVKDQYRIFSENSQEYFKQNS